MKYNICLGISIAGSWSIFLISGIYFFYLENNSKFFHFGPSEVIFGGFKINTWNRWYFVMNYSVLSQISQTIVSSNVSPYISNVIRDYKTPIKDKGSKINAQYIVLIYRLYYWLSSIFDIFLWITLQLQYIIPGIIIDLLLSIYFTNKYMSNDNYSNTLNLLH